jgi:spore coat polysaccharide biosynthesis protein SpsF
METKWQSFDIHSEALQGVQAFFPCMIIVQGRMGSTRLPGKVMKEVLGKPLLFYLVERLRKVEHIEGICIATTLNPIDDVIANFCNAESLHCFRGSEEDVLSRYFAAAEAFDVEACVRITADCPLIDPMIISKAIYTFRHHYDELDYLSNTLDRTFPRGMDVEIFRKDALQKTYFHAKSASDKEHVTSYMVKHPHHFRLGNLYQKKDTSSYRLTVDTQEDFELIRIILEKLYPHKQEFHLEDILRLFATYPELKEINAHVAQKEMK